MNKIEPGVAGVGLMAARGFWSTYTWEHIAAQCGVDLFDGEWNPIFNNDAGIKALEIILDLQKNAAQGVAGLGWPENRAAWLGGQLGHQHLLAGQRHPGHAAGPEPDRRRLRHHLRAAGRTSKVPGFAPPNIAGSTSCVASTSQNPEGAFLMLAFLTTASIMAMNEANANGVAPGYKSVLNNPNGCEAVSQPAEGLGREP